MSMGCSRWRTRTSSGRSHRSIRPRPRIAVSRRSGPTTRTGGTPSTTCVSMSCRSPRSATASSRSVASTARDRRAGPTSRSRSPSWPPTRMGRRFGSRSSWTPRKRYAPSRPRAVESPPIWGFSVAITTMNPHSSAVRPSVGVVVPFRGDRTAANRMLAGLGCLDLRDGDEVIVADNTADGAARGVADARIRVVAAARERSSYHARNAGARAATNEWILFLDADCSPQLGLLAAYFGEPIAEGCGAVAGQILGDPDQTSFATRYARSRKLFDHADGLIRADGGGAAAGNLLVRRAAFERIGGFTEGIRSGGDLDLCRPLRGRGALAQRALSGIVAALAAPARPRERRARCRRARPGGSHRGRCVSGH